MIIKKSDVLRHLFLKKYQFIGILSFGLGITNASHANFFNHTWGEFDLGGGYQHLSASSVTEISKGGYFFNGRAQFQYRSANIGDFALGFGMQRTYQNGQTAFRLQQFVSQTFLVDFSYLYPLADRNLLVGALLRDSSGQGAQFDFSNTTSYQQLIFIGPQIKFQFARSDSLEWSAGAAILISINGVNRTILDIPVYVGLSFPFPEHGVDDPDSPTATPSTTAPTSSPSPSPPPVSQIQVDSEPAPHETSHPVVVQLVDQPINFDLSQATLRPATRAFLTQLAKKLNAQLDHWQSLLIAGHTDITGSVESNQLLSEHRAQGVGSWLIQKGVPADRIQTKGYAAEKLLPELPEDSEQHRRVELILDGVLNDVKFNDPTDALKIPQSVQSK